MASQNQEGDEHTINIPPPTNQTASSSSSHHDGISIHQLIPSTTQMVLSVVALLIFKVHKLRLPHTHNLFTMWLLVYSSACALMIPLLYFQNRTARRWRLSPSEETEKKCKVVCFLNLTMSCFFLAWFIFATNLLKGIVVSEPSFFERLYVALSLIGCFMLGLPGFFYLILPCLVLESPICGPEISVLAVYKFEAKENGRGEVLGAAGTMECSLSGEDGQVCCIWLEQCEDNEELWKLPCCGHLFHVECVDKWLTKKARCPLCQSDLGGAATS